MQGWAAARGRRQLLAPPAGHQHPPTVPPTRLHVLLLLQLLFGQSELLRGQALVQLAARAAAAARRKRQPVGCLVRAAAAAAERPLLVRFRLGPGRCCGRLLRRRWRHWRGGTTAAARLRALLLVLPRCADASQHSLPARRLAAAAATAATAASAAAGAAARAAADAAAAAASGRLCHGLQKLSLLLGRQLRRSRIESLLHAACPGAGAGAGCGWRRRGCWRCNGRLGSASGVLVLASLGDACQHLVAAAWAAPPPPLPSASARHGRRRCRRWCRSGSGWGRARNAVQIIMSQLCRARERAGRRQRERLGETGPRTPSGRRPGEFLFRLAQYTEVSQRCPRRC